MATLVGSTFFEGESFGFSSGPSMRSGKSVDTVALKPDAHLHVDQLIPECGIGLTRDEALGFEDLHVKAIKDSWDRVFSTLDFSSSRRIQLEFQLPDIPATPPGEIASKSVQISIHRLNLTPSCYLINKRNALLGDVEYLKIHVFRYLEFLSQVRESPDAKFEWPSDLQHIADQIPRRRIQSMIAQENYRAHRRRNNLSELKMMGPGGNLIDWTCRCAICKFRMT